MLSIVKIFAGEGWRYPWEQVASGGEDYYLVGVAAGELPGRWSGAAASTELGLRGEVTELQMRRLFGRLAHPVTARTLGRPPRRYRSFDERLETARWEHDSVEAARWAGQRLSHVDGRGTPGRLAVEEATWRAADAER